MAELFRTDPPRLVGGYSAASGLHHFPLAPVCPYTGAEDVEEMELSDHGALWLWTTVAAAPPGYVGEVPYGFGIVELPESLRVVTRLALPGDDWAAGMPVRLRIVTVGRNDDGNPVRTWEFGP